MWNYVSFFQTGVCYLLQVTLDRKLKRYSSTALCLCDCSHSKVGSAVSIRNHGQSRHIMGDWPSGRQLSLHIIYSGSEWPRNQIISVAPAKNMCSLTQRPSARHHDGLQALFKQIPWVKMSWTTTVTTKAGAKSVREAEDKNPSPLKGPRLLRMTVGSPATPGGTDSSMITPPPHFVLVLAFALAMVTTTWGDSYIAGTGWPSQTPGE